MSRPAAMRPARAGRPKGITRRVAHQKRVSLVHAVCLIGFRDIIPRRLGDNRGAYPVAVVTTKKPREAPKNYDRGQPYHHVEILEYCRVETEEHAKRLKAAIDRGLVGRMADQNNDPARGLWRDVIGCFDPADADKRHMWWIAMLLDAEMQVARTIRNFRSYDSREKVASAEDDLIRGLR